VSFDWIMEAFLSMFILASQDNWPTHMLAGMDSTGPLTGRRHHNLHPTPYTLHSTPYTLHPMLVLVLNPEPPVQAQQLPGAGRLLHRGGDAPSSSFSSLLSLQVLEGP